MRKPAIFLSLTFLLSWPVAFLAFGRGMNLYKAGGLVVAVYFMFTPSIAAVITQKLIYRQNLMSLGISFRPNGWFDQNKVRMGRLHLLFLAPVDQAGRVVSPTKDRQSNEVLQQALIPVTPYNMYLLWLLAVGSCR